MTTMAGTSKRIAEYLRKIEGVVQAEPIHGRYDVIVLAETKDQKTFNDIVYKAVGEIPEVIKSETCICHFQD